MRHSMSRPSFLPISQEAVDPHQVRIAVTTLGLSIITLATVVALIVRFL